MALKLLGGGLTPGQLVADLNSNFLELKPLTTANIPRIVKTGTVTGTAVLSGSISIFVTHGLNYIPQVDVWMKSKTNNAYKSLPCKFGAGTTPNEWFDFNVGPTQLEIVMELGAASSQAGLLSFKYQIYDVPVN